MKTTLLAALFAAGIAFAGSTGASATENATMISRAGSSTVTLSAGCRLIEVCRRYWWPHCRLVKVCKPWW